MKKFTLANNMNSDFEIIQERIVDTITILKTPDTDIDLYYKMLQPDGRFADIDYSQDEPSLFGPNIALKRILDLLKAYNLYESKYYQSEHLFGLLNGALHDWSNNDYKSYTNHWYNTIGIPAFMVDITVLLPESFDNECKKKLIDIAFRGTIKGWADENGIIENRREEFGNSATGANLVDFINTSVKVAVADKDERFMKTLMKIFEDELQIFSPSEYPFEGIMPDYSFHQHGSMLYQCGYGEVFYRRCCAILKYIRGTKFQIHPSGLYELVCSILDGEAYMFFGDYNDFNLLGRGIARPVNGYGMREFLKTAVIPVLLEYKELPRYNELLDFYEKRIKANDNGFNGAKHFWTSDYTVFQRENFRISILMASQRTKVAESINNENLLSFWCNYGATCITRTGEEYFNIYPLWQWDKIPGTTSVEGVEKNAHSYYTTGDVGFVGGVSDGMYACSTYEINREPVVARKSYFMFDEGMVCLGNIRGKYDSNHPNKNVFTTINQCYKKTDIIVKTNNLVNTYDSFNGEIPNTSWVLQDKIGYYFPKNDNVSIESGNKTENWSRLSKCNDKIETADVFTILLNHGKTPGNQTYEYIVMPDITTGKLDEFSENPAIIVAKNTKYVQSVWHKDKKILQAIFLANDFVEIEKLKIKVDKPCALLIRFINDDDYEVTVSNPYNLPLCVNVNINGENILFNLPGGFSAGKSVKYNKSGFYYGNVSGEGMTEYFSVKDKEKYITGLSQVKGDSVKINFRLNGRYQTPSKIIINVFDNAGITEYEYNAKDFITKDRIYDFGTEIRITDKDSTYMKILIFNDLSDDKHISEMFLIPINNEKKG